MKAPAPIEREAFRAWLESKHPAAKVGLACMGHACPIATFLDETTDAESAVVGLGVFWPDSGEDDSYALPSWASQFVQMIDGPDDDNAGHEVCAAGALRALDLVGA